MDNSSHSILCVDDDINILNSLKRLLRKDGYTIFTSENTTEALDIFHDNSINMVLCDQRMPGMSGTEFLSVIREKYPEVMVLCSPVIQT